MDPYDSRTLFLAEWMMFSQSMHVSPWIRLVFNKAKFRVCDQNLRIALPITFSLFADLRQMDKSTHLCKTHVWVCDSVCECVWMGVHAGEHGALNKDFSLLLSSLSFEQPHVHHRNASTWVWLTEPGVQFQGRESERWTTLFSTTDCLQKCSQKCFGEFTEMKNQPLLRHQVFHHRFA